MDARLQKRVQRYGWDKAASYYERCWQHQLVPAQTTLLDVAALRRGERVLDVACGTGLVTLKAAREVGPDGEVIGTDISEEMIAVANSVAGASGLRNVSFARMDAERLDYPDVSFDVVLCALGLMYAPDPERAIAEMHRVTKDGGRAVAAVWGERRLCGWSSIFPIVDARVHSEVCPMFFRLGTGDALRHAFASAGFRNISLRRLQTTLAYADTDEACAAAFVGGPVALAYSRFSDAMKSEAHDAYLHSIEPYRSGDGYAVPGEFVIVAGSR